jgi:hypothetical protein
MKENDFVKKLVAATALLLFGRYDTSKGGVPLTTKLDLTAKQRASLVTLERDGIQIIPGYYSAAQCAVLREEIDSIIEGARDAAWVDDQKSDHRVNAAERVSADVAAFCDDPFIVDIARALSKRELLPRFTLAARLEPKEGGKGSGAGWHRDSLGFQFKAMLYLSAVTMDNGPFQYFRGSQKRFYKIRNYLADLSQGFSDIVRYSDDHVAKLPQNDLVTAMGKAGDLVLFNSSGVHRGMPTLAGVRYALTIYFFNEPWGESWEKQLIARPGAAMPVPRVAR